MKTLRRLIARYRFWRMRRELYRAYPMLAELDTMETRFRNSHQRGVESARRLKADIMEMALRGDL